jgi:hypothetical protein
MFKDTQFVITFQLALIGIVLIGGLFLIWKAITRIEEKVDMIILQQDAKALHNFKIQMDNSGLSSIQSCDKSKNECCPLNMMKSDKVMQELFKDATDENKPPIAIITSLESFVVQTPFSAPDEDDQYNDNSVLIEDVSNIQNDDKAMSEVSEYVSGGVLSKTKLRQMNLEKIKLLCEEKGISSDGTKNSLIEKLIQLQ